jgi:transposase-like protein
MIKSDVTCPVCNGGYRRIELSSRLGVKGEFRCKVCDYVLEVFDGTKDVALRLTVQPVKRGQSVPRLDSLRHTFHS